MNPHQSFPHWNAGSCLGYFESKLIMYPWASRLWLTQYGRLKDVGLVAIHKNVPHFTKLHGHHYSLSWVFNVIFQDNQSFWYHSEISHIWLKIKAQKTFPIFMQKLCKGIDKSSYRSAINHKKLFIDFARGENFYLVCNRLCLLSSLVNIQFTLVSIITA